MEIQTKVVEIPGILKPIFYRPINEDISVINMVFGQQEYRLPIENLQPKLILDCGGNIGCSAVYFANKYPYAQIYSVEPEEENFTLLKYNTCFYDNVHLIRSALWDRETFIRVEDKGFGKWGFMTFETTADDPAAIKTTTIGRILADSGFDEIDLLKINLNGAEKEIFAAPDVDEWLSKVKVIVIKLFDRMRLGCSYEFFKAISKYKWFFASAFSGENLFFIREDLMTNKNAHFDTHLEYFRKAFQQT